MSEGRKEVGAFGEKVAKDYLKKKGYRILYENFACRLGEIDVVAEDGDIIVFVEIRTRSSSYFGSPMESILWKKRRKLVMLANFYIKKFNLENGNFRFDVIGIVKSKGVVDIKLIKDAFWEV